MDKLILGAITAGLLALNSGVVFAKLTQSEQKASKDAIEAEYKSAKAQCDGLAGNAKDICMAEAKGNRKVAKADLTAQDKGTSKARQQAREARAEAGYAIAKERCDDKGGNEKDVCIKEARAARTAAMADAKVDRKAADAHADADKTVAKARGKEAERVSEARKDADAQKRDADYAVARERCDNFAGDAKSRCLDEARARYVKR